MYEIFVGRDSEDRKKFGKKGTFLLGKNYVKMGQTSSLSNEVIMDVARSHVVFVTGKRGSGKCLSGDTLVALGDGRLVPISRLENDSSSIIALDSKLKTIATSKSSFYKRRVGKLLRIRTRSGRSIKLTPEHPLLSLRGWVPASDFIEGDRLATPSRIPNFGREVLLEKEIVRMAGLLSGSSGDAGREIPESVMRLSKPMLSLFLRTVFSRFGMIFSEETDEGNVWRISCHAPSRVAAEQLRHVLLRYGIISSIGKSRRQKQPFRLEITGEHVLTFLEEIGFSGSSSSIQKQALSELFFVEKDSQAETFGSGKFSGGSENRPVSSGLTLLRASFSESEFMSNMAASDIFWDEIIRIEHVSGDFEVYDLTVPEFHNFVAGDVIVHNSYTMASIAEGMMSLPEEVTSRISVVMFDTMGIYWTMKYENKKDGALLRDWGLEYADLNAKIYVPSGHFEKSRKKGIPVDAEFSIKPSELSVADWCATFNVEITSPVGSLIGRVVSDLKEKEMLGIDDIIAAVQSDERTDESTRSAAENLFLTAKEWGLFDRKGVSFSELVAPGQVSVIDVSGYASSVNRGSVRALVIGLISKKLFSERMEIRKAEEYSSVKTYTSILSPEKNREKEMPLIWIMVDEAHEFLPRQGFTPATDALQTLLREGRQPGISLVLASQQPGQIHTDVMTQSDIVIAHHLTARIDIDSLGALMQSYMRSGLDKVIAELPDAKGAAVLFDDINERLYPIRVRPRITWHGGGSPTVLDEKKKFSL